MHSRARLQPFRVLAAVIAVATAAVALGSCGDGDARRHLVGYRPSGVQSVLEVELPDVAHPDEDFRFQADPDGLMIVYFGYTSCPDICPTSLSIVKSSIAELGDDGDRISLAMATIDPVRDTPDVLSGYVGSFVDGAHALRTDDPERLRSAASAFGVSYEVRAGAGDRVEVAHSGAMYAVDDEGRVVLTWPFGVTKDDVLGDLELLLADT